MYNSLLVFLGAAIVLAVYRSELLLCVYSLLIAGGMLYHIFVLGTVEFGTSIQVAQFIVRFAITFTAFF